LEYLYLESQDFKVIRSYFQQIPHLKTLSHWEIDTPLEENIFPNTLESLNITYYNLPIGIRVIPISLGKLKIEDYNQPLQPFVLPNGLKNLKMPCYNHLLVKNSLPTSLVKLILKMDSPSTGSFQDVDVLDKLVYLKVDLLQRLISRIVSRCHYIRIESLRISDNFSLHDTSIEKLILIKHEYYKSPIPLEAIIPHRLERLALFGFTISSYDIIPKTCIYFKTNIPNFNKKLLPPSVIMYRSVEYNYSHRYIDNLN